VVHVLSTLGVVDFCILITVLFIGVSARLLYRRTPLMLFVAATTKVAVHDAVSGAQMLVAVKVTDTEPPVAGGAPAPLLPSVVLHPPDKVAEASQSAYASFTAACVLPRDII
jgi:hypothetical protein